MLTFLPAQRSMRTFARFSGLSARATAPGWRRSFTTWRFRIAPTSLATHPRRSSWWRSSRPTTRPARSPSRRRYWRAAAWRWRWRATGSPSGRGMPRRRRSSGSPRAARTAGRPRTRSRSWYGTRSRQPSGPTRRSSCPWPRGCGGPTTSARPPLSPESPPGGRPARSNSRSSPPGHAARGSGCSASASSGRRPSSGRTRTAASGRSGAARRRPRGATAGLSPARRPGLPGPPGGRARAGPVRLRGAPVGPNRPTRRDGRFRLPPGYRGPYIHLRAQVGPIYFGAETLFGTRGNASEAWELVE